MKFSDAFSSKTSDAMRAIKGATEKFNNDEPDPNVVKAFEGVSGSTVVKTKKHPGGRPKKKLSEKSKNTKRVSLYMTEAEYDLFSEYAFRRREKLSEFIVRSALNGMEKPAAELRKLEVPVDEKRLKE